MAILQQVISSNTNSTPGSLDSGYYKGQRYVIYASGKSILVYNTNFEYVQRIALDDKSQTLHGSTADSVIAVAFCSRDGKIAISYGTVVVVFRPITGDDKDDIRWTYLTTLPHSYYVQCLSWSIQGRLVTAGSHLSVWSPPRPPARHSSLALVEDLKAAISTNLLAEDEEDKAHKRDPSSSGESAIGNSQTSLSGSKATLDDKEKGLDPYVLEWTIPSASEVFRVKYSPDGLFFATCGDNDRLMKIWYRSTRSPSPSYSFIYIPHPRSVVEFSWRTPPTLTTPSTTTANTNSKSNNSEPNILLTLCRDNICRLWCQDGHSEPYQYYMYTSIDPTQCSLPTSSTPSSVAPSQRGSMTDMLPAINEESTTGIVEQTGQSMHASMISNTTSTTSTASSSKICAIHWLDPKELLSAISTREAEEQQYLRSRHDPELGPVGSLTSSVTSAASNTGTNSATSSSNNHNTAPNTSTEDVQKGSKLREAIKDNPDMLFHVTEDGTLVIWGIQNVGQSPRRIPKIRMVMTEPNALLPQDAPFFDGNILVYHNPAIEQEASVCFPTELTIIAQNQLGVLNQYLINLEDFFTSSRTTAHFRLSSVQAGHRRLLKTALRHPALPWMVSLSEEGVLIIWRVNVPKICIRTKKGLEMVTRIEVKEEGGIQHIAWVPATTAPYLILATREKVRVLNVLDFEEQGRMGDTMLETAITLPGLDTGLHQLVYLEGFFDPEADAYWKSVVVGGNGAKDGKVKDSDANADAGFDDFLKALEGDAETALAAVNPANSDNSKQPDVDMDEKIVEDGLKKPITVHIVALNSTDNMSYVWTVTFEDNRITAYTLVTQDPLPLPSATKIHYAHASDHLSAMYAPYCPLGAHLFMTYTSDSKVRFWHVRDGTFASLSQHSHSKRIWCEVTDFQIATPKVLWMDLNAFGKMLIVSESSSDSSALEAVIWSHDATGLDMIKESTLRFDKSCPIIQSDWFFSSDGQHLLALATPNKVTIYCQERLTNVTEETRWIPLTEISGATFGGDIKYILWLQTASLMIATDNLMMVYDKWFEQEELSSLATPNIITLASKRNGRLPDHHPQLLIQYLLWGKFELVRYILYLLYRFVKLMVESKDATIKDIPMPLWKLLADEDGTSGSGTGVNTYSTKAGYDGLFETPTIGEDGLVVVPEVEGELSETQASYLNEQLTRTSLPIINNLEQMQLMGVVDTMVQIEKLKRSLDENGVRYLLSMKMFLYSSRSLPVGLRPVQLTSRDIVWAYHSESQDVLLEHVTNAVSGKMLWKDARSLGTGFWLRNPEALRRLVETVARNQYMHNDNRDPVECSLYYLAMKRKNVLLKLWESANAHSEQAAMLKFLANDFTEDRWQKAASKNAFVLLSKQRFEYAVAFFLLADKPKDAVNVCLKHLNDVQLALVICRSFEGEDGPLLQEVLKNHVLPTALKASDRWLTSMAFSMLKEKDKALYAIMMPLHTLAADYVDAEVMAAISNSSSVTDPSLLLFYNHLRKSYQNMRFNQPKIPSDVEYKFIFESASAYERLGLPVLALDIIRKSVTTAESSAADIEYTSPTANMSGTIQDWELGGGSITQPTGATSSSNAGGFDWGEPVAAHVQDNSKDFDWGAPVSKLADTSSAMDWGEPVSTLAAGGNTTGGGIDWSEPVSSMTTRDALDDDFLKRKPTAVTTSITTAKSDDRTAFRTNLEKRNFRLYKWVLAMRIVQAACYSAESVSRNFDILKHDVAFKDYFSKLHQGFKELCQLVDMPLYVMDRVLDSRCKEADKLVAYIEILPLHGTMMRYKDLLVGFMEEECNTLARLTLVPEDVYQSYTGHMEDFAKHLLWSLIRWQEKNGSTSTSSNDDVLPEIKNSIGHAGVAAFIALVVCYLKQKNYKMLYQITCQSMQFLENLMSGNIMALQSVIRDILQEKLDSSKLPEGVGLSPEEDEGSDLEYDDYGLPKPRAIPDENHEVAEQFLRMVVLQYFIICIDLTLNRMDDNVYDHLHTFVTDAILKRLSKMHLSMEEKIGTLWDKTKFEKISDLKGFLVNADKKKLWNLMAKVNNPFNVFGKFMEAKRAEQNRLEEEKRKTEQQQQQQQQPTSEKVPQVVVTSGMSRMASSVSNPELSTLDDGKSSRPSFVKPSLNDKSSSTFELIYKTRDMIDNFAFAINPLDPNVMAIATHKGVYEIDVAASTQFFERKQTRSRSQSQSQSQAPSQTHSVAHSRSASQRITSTAPEEPEFNLFANLRNLNSNSNAAKKQQQHDDSTESLEVTSGTGSSTTATSGTHQTEAMTQRSMSDNAGMHKSSSQSSRKTFGSIWKRHSNQSGVDNGMRLKRQILGVTAIEAHPTLNYFLAGIYMSSDSGPAHINLYQFGQPSALLSYTTGNSNSSRITKIHFDHFGHRFGATDAKGEIYLWKFEASQKALQPYQTISCHSNVTNDFAFLSSGSLLATGGLSTNHTNVCLWDTLLPPQKMRIKAFTVSETGASSVVYTHRHQLLISGGKKGDINIFDLRQRLVLNTFQAHDSAIKTLAIDEESDVLISGSTDGDIKLWDLTAFQERERWKRMHTKHHVLRAPSMDRAPVGTYAVMQICCKNGYVYSCGADGAIQRVHSNVLKAFDL